MSKKAYPILMAGLALVFLAEACCIGAELMEGRRAAPAPSIVAFNIASISHIAGADN